MGPPLAANLRVQKRGVPVSSKSRSEAPALAITAARVVKALGNLGPPRAARRAKAPLGPQASLHSAATLANVQPVMSPSASPGGSFAGRLHVGFVALSFRLGLEASPKALAALVAQIDLTVPKAGELAVRFSAWGILFGPLRCLSL